MDPKRIVAAGYDAIAETYLTLTRGGSDGAVEEDWLGAPMFFAGEDPETNLDRLRASGFELVRAELVPQLEFGREVQFLWVLARRAGS